MPRRPPNRRARDRRAWRHYWRIALRGGRIRAGGLPGIGDAYTEVRAPCLDRRRRGLGPAVPDRRGPRRAGDTAVAGERGDRKSTRLNLQSRENLVCRLLLE